MVMAKVDLRKLKDAATAAFTNQKWGKAAELYAEISTQEPTEPDWFGRQGECWRKLGDPKRAVAAFSRAAEGYAKNGFLLKAIAVCKTILQVDPRHTVTQAMLADLYARRDDGKGPLTPGPVLTPPPARTVVPPRAVAPTPAPIPVEAPFVDERTTIDLAARPPFVPPVTREVALPPGAAIEALSLHQVLGGRQSGSFEMAEVTVLEGEPEPSAYEIELGDDEIEFSSGTSGEFMAAAPAPPAQHVAPEVIVPPAPRVVAAVAAAVAEDDFSDLLVEDTTPSTAPLPTSSALPRIPLFSSLSPERLQQLIESLALREVPAGTVLVREGEAGVSLFVIVTGRARVTIASSPTPLAELGEGSFFGELGLLTDFPRSASVVAATELSVLEISRELIARLIADEPDVLRVLLRFFRERMVDRWLKTSALFATMSPDDARALAARWKLIEVDPNIQIISAGKRAEGMFLLLCGDARVVQNRQLVARLRPGEIFGEMSLLSTQPATSAVESETKCWALCLERQHFQEIMVTYPQVLEYVSEIVAARQSGTVRPVAP